MDVEKLIKEQQETQKYLKILKDNGTLDKFLEAIEPAEDLGISFSISNWDYDVSNKEIGLYLAEAFRQAGNNLSRAKALLHYIDGFYNDHINQWAEFKKWCEDNDKDDVWPTMYQNPQCLDFFEKYEEEHGIKNSIYQEAKKELARKEKK